MSRATIIGVIVLMSISLLGVVGLQLYWITDAIKVKEEQFDRSVHEALRKVVAKLETQEAVSVVTGQMAALHQPAAAPSAPAIAPPPEAPAASPRPRQQQAATPRATPPLPLPKPAEPVKAKSSPPATPPAVKAAGAPSMARYGRKGTDSLLILHTADGKRYQQLNITGSPELPSARKFVVLPAPDSAARELLQNKVMLRAVRTTDSIIKHTGIHSRPGIFMADTLRHLVNRLDSVRIIKVSDNRLAISQLNPSDIRSISVRNDTILIIEKKPPVVHRITSAGKPGTVALPKPIEVTAGKAAPAPVVPARVKAASGIAATTRPAAVTAATSTTETSRVETKKEKLNEVVKQMVVEYMVKDVPLQERLNLHRLNGLLQSELAGQGIGLDFGYWVVSGKSDTVAARPVQQAGIVPFPEYKVSLFPNDIYEKPDYLAVYFPGSRSYALQSLWLMLLLSGVFTLIISLTFGTTIYIIFRQKKLSEMKNDFINNMTHEFKTPIATISLATDSISNPKIYENPDKIRYYNNIIREENKRMNAQVENVLQIALLEKNEFKMNLQPVDVHALIVRAVERIKLQVEQRAGQITVQLDALHHELLSDEVHLYNAICNLLDNANKYSPSSPDIHLCSRNLNGGIVIAVEDKGLGMTKDTQQRVFEKFYRVPTGNLHNVKGFGLGLSYVKAIVEAHRGNIRLESEPGKGSRFEIFLPVTVV